MNSGRLGGLIRIISVIWGLIALILLGLLLAGWVSKTMFQWLFVGGFVVFALVSAVLSNLNASRIRGRGQATGDEGEEP